MIFKYWLIVNLLDKSFLAGCQKEPGDFDKTIIAFIPDMGIHLRITEPMIQLKIRLIKSNGK